MDYFFWLHEKKSYNHISKYCTLLEKIKVVTKISYRKKRKNLSNFFGGELSNFTSD